VFTEERILQRWELEEDSLTVFNQGAEPPNTPPDTITLGISNFSYLQIHEACWQDNAQLNTLQ